MKKYRYLILVLIALTTTFGCIEDELMEELAPEIEGSAVVMNEIMSNDVGDGLDWIEIYNKTTEDIDLGGYILNDADAVEGGWAIPSGTVVPAGGYIVFEEETDWDFGGVSSGGEWVSFADATGTLIDQIYVPSMSLNAGLTYAREVDGGEVWLVAAPTRGAMNGDVATAAPTILTDVIDSETFLYDGEEEGDDEVSGEFTFTASVADPDGVSFVKLWLSVNGALSVNEMVFNGEEYQYTIDLENDDIVFYYIYADDATGLRSFFPETAPTEYAYFVVKNVWMDAPEFTNFAIDNDNPALTDVVSITFDYTWMFDVALDDARFYYVLNDGEYTKDNKLKVAELLSGTNSDGSWRISFLTSDIEDNTDAPVAIQSGDILRFFIRMEDSKGEHYFINGEEEDEEDVKDDPSAWDIITVQ